MHQIYLKIFCVYMFAVVNVYVKFASVCVCVCVCVRTSVCLKFGSV